MLRLTASLLVGFALLIARPGTGTAQVTSAVHLLIDAVAVDRNNMPVMDLSPGEVEVWIAGYRVPIASLRPITSRTARSGRAIVLVLDDVTVAPAMAPRVREIARRFVDRMAPGDSMAVVTFDGRNGELSADRARLLERIDAYNVRASGLRMLDALGAQALDVVGTVARQVATEEPRRNTIVAIGSAPLFDTPLPPPFAGRELRPEWTDAMRALAFANADLYVIDPLGMAVGRTFSGANGFARETGGFAFLHTNDFAGAVERIMREAGNYYLIEVVDPPRQRKAALRELDLRVHRKGVTIRARRGIPGTEAPVKK